MKQDILVPFDGSANARRLCEWQSIWPSIQRENCSSQCSAEFRDTAYQTIFQVRPD